MSVTTDKSTIIQLVCELLENQPITPNQVVDPEQFAADSESIPESPIEFKVAMSSVVDSTPEDAIRPVFKAAKDAADAAVLDLSAGLVGNDESRSRREVKVKQTAENRIRNYVRSLLETFVSVNDEDEDEDNSEQKLRIDAVRMLTNKFDPITATKEQFEDIARGLSNIMNFKVVVKMSKSGKPQLGAEKEENNVELWSIISQAAERGPLASTPVVGSLTATDAEAEPNALERDEEVELSKAESDKRRDELEDKALSPIEPRDFREIATDLGLSVSGAKQAVDKAMAKLKFLHDLDNEKRLNGRTKLEQFLVFAIDSFIDALLADKAIDVDDSKFMRKHPELVTDMEMFRKYIDEPLWDMQHRHPLWTYTGKSGGGWTRKGDKNESTKNIMNSLNESEDYEQKRTDKPEKFKCDLCGKEKVSKNVYVSGSGKKICSACHSTQLQNRKSV